MRPTSVLAGASRLPLTPKRGNKDFYKGTGQSRVPGGGHRTGPPGVHVVRGKAKYRLIDEQVRVFVGPGENYDVDCELRPYVGTRHELPGSKSRFFNPFSRSSLNRPSLPSFSPNLQLPSPSSSEAQQISRKDFTAFSKRYQALSGTEKQALIMHSRREWWNAMTSLYPPAGQAPASGHGQGGQSQVVSAEEERTREVEERAGRGQGAEQPRQPAL